MLLMSASTERPIRVAKGSARSASIRHVIECRAVRHGQAIDDCNIAAHCVLSVRHFSYRPNRDGVEGNLFRGSFMEFYAS